MNDNILNTNHITMPYDNTAPNLINPSTIQQIQNGLNNNYVPPDKNVFFDNVSSFYIDYIQPNIIIIFLLILMIFMLFVRYYFLSDIIDSNKNKNKNIDSDIDTDTDDDSDIDNNNLVKNNKIQKSVRFITPYKNDSDENIEFDSIFDSDDTNSYDTPLNF
jgi:hypothetical protein